MTKKRTSLGSTRLWILILSITLVVLNIIVFRVYQKSHITEDFWTQLWEYLKSDAFKYLTISLILPILSLFLENLFEIRKVVEERIEKEKQAGLEARWKCVEKTVNAWNELFSAINELVYFKNEANKKTGNDETEKTSIEDIQKKIGIHTMSMTELVNSLSFWFPNLRRVRARNGQDLDFNEYVVYFANMLYLSVDTVAYHIQRSSETKKIDELQNTLLAIQYGVRSLVYHPVLFILKSSIAVWEGKKDENRTKIADAEATIQKNLESLKASAEWLRREELEHNEILPALKGREGNALRNASRKLEKLAKKHPEAELVKSKEYLKFRKLFTQIEHEDLVRPPIGYSLEWVRHLSDQLRYKSYSFYVLDRAKWIRAREQN